MNDPVVIVAELTAWIDQRFTRSTTTERDKALLNDLSQWIAKIQCVPPAPPQAQEPTNRHIQAFDVVQAWAQETHDGCEPCRECLAALHKAVNGALAASPPAQAQEPSMSNDSFIEQAVKLSGCSWHCHKKGSAEIGYGACCSSCQRIADALMRAAALPPAQGWQPMESYPKNRAPWVLLWWPYWKSHPVVGRWEASIGDWWSEAKLEGANEGPLGWMPLPPPPVARGWHAEKEQP